MATSPRQSDPPTDFAPDVVHGFAYCRELPPDVPPGMTLDEWRRAHRRQRRTARGPRVRRRSAPCHPGRPSLAKHWPSLRLPGRRRPS